MPGYTMEPTIKQPPENTARRRRTKGGQTKQLPPHDAALARAQRKLALEPWRTVQMDPGRDKTFLPKVPIPWANAWPEAVNYYLSHHIDSTGMKAYGDTIQGPVARKLAVTSYSAWSVQVLAAERARPIQLSKADKIMGLKTWVIGDLRKRLETLSIATSQDVMKGADLPLLVAALCSYESVWEDDEAAADAHRHGLQRLVRLYGGWERVQSLSPLSRYIAYVDAAHDHFWGTGYMILSEEDQATLFFTVNSFRLALQPMNSPKLGSSRIKHHLMMSFGSPTRRYYEVLDYIQSLPYEETAVEKAKPQPQPLSSKRKLVLQSIDSKQDYLYEADTLHSGLNPDFYSEVDMKNHEAIHHMLRSCCLIMIVRARQYFVSRTFDSSALDHHVQALFCDLLRPTPGILSSRVLCWAFCIGLPHLTDIHEDKTALVHPSSESTGEIFHTSIRTFTRLCHSLVIYSYEDLRDFMRNIWYCSPLMEEDMRRMWKHVESQDDRLKIE